MSRPAPLPMAKWKRHTVSGVETSAYSQRRRQRWDIRGWACSANMSDSCPAARRSAWMARASLLTASPYDRAAAGRYDALLLPGGVMNADTLRRDEKALRFVKSFFESGKPVAAICHAPWTLIDAGVVHRRTLTSFESIQTDLKNAGAT